ncbi:glycosyltransferase family 4 protein [Deferribacter autotrophicus]|uniref:Glycosyltransferase family 4 protein n=1 Tax=Deferribacter autotrophicus TaxID=500465 RepID=A0A5A8F6V2_9BACT|nr:glycosyltransferase [Deferribacter autotrophicus]KAA0258999.1 glycosyltransferase family 4 protein [Deferribacter autotrophicus]
MKPVLFRVTNNLNIGGVQRRMLDVLSHFVNDYDIHVVVYKEKGVLAEEFEKKGIKIHFVKAKGTFDFLAILKISKLMKKYKADIVHTHSMGGNIKGLIAAYLAGVKKRFAHVHVKMELHWYGRSKLKRLKHQLEEKIILCLFAKKIFFVSKSILDEFLKRFSLGLQEKCLVLYNGFDVESFPVKSLNHDKEFFKLGVALRLVESKNLTFIVDTIAILKNFKNNFKFYFVGDGPYKDYLQNYIKEKNLEVYFEFVGETKNPYSYITDFDLVVFPSKNEGLPAGLIEPLLMKVPVVAVDTEINREVINIYNGGILLEENPELFAKKIAEVLDNYEVFYKSLSFEKYHNEFDIKSHLFKLRKFYEGDEE